MSKHTPGPWKTGSCDPSIIWASGWRSVSIIECPDTPDEAISVGYVANPGWAYLGKIFVEPDSREDWVMECHANARLMAAAPDMLAALKAVVRVADRATVEFDAARDAIAKAEGRS